MILLAPSVVRIMKELIMCLVSVRLLGRCGETWTFLARWTRGRVTYTNVFNKVFIEQLNEKTMFAKAILSCWAIWKLRNDKVFQKQ